jgi:hypothetical protein
VLARPVARAWLGAALRRPAGLLLVGWPLAVGLAVFIASLGRYYPAHGRYLLPALPPLALGLALGWRAAAPGRLPVPWRLTASRHLPALSRLPLPAPRTLAPWALVAGLAALNLYCLLGVVVPRYYGPAATRVVVTVDEPRPGDRAGDAVLVRGWAVVTGRDAWRQGAIGGPPAWHAVATTVWATVDGAPALAGGAGVPRPDVARALDAPALATAGFAYRWDAHAAPPGVHTLAICAADPATSDAVCVAVPVRVAGE